MGFIHVNVGLAKPFDTEPAEMVRVMVDTGAIISVFPAELLERLGIQRVGQQRFRGNPCFNRRSAAAGSVVRSVGGVAMTYGDVTSVVPVAFGDENDTAVMGVTALETLGYEVDPVRGELHRVEMLL